MILLYIGVVAIAMLLLKAARAVTIMVWNGTYFVKLITDLGMGICANIIGAGVVLLFVLLPNISAFETHYKIDLYRMRVKSTHWTPFKVWSTESPIWQFSNVRLLSNTSYRHACRIEVTVNGQTFVLEDQLHYQTAQQQVRKLKQYFRTEEKS